MTDEVRIERRSKPVFDGTINLGHILTAGSFIVASVLFAGGIQSTLSALEERVADLEVTEDAFDALQTRVTVAETTVANVNRTLDTILAEVRAAGTRLTNVQLTVTAITTRLDERIPPGNFAE